MFEAKQSDRNVNRERQDIPSEFDYEQIVGLRRETREKLTRYRPPTVESASKISGITSADIRIISIYFSHSNLRLGNARRLDPSQIPG